MGVVRLISDRSIVDFLPFMASLGGYLTKPSGEVFFLKGDAVKAEIINSKLLGMQICVPNDYARAFEQSYFQAIAILVCFINRGN